MELRLIEITARRSQNDEVRRILAAHDVSSSWSVPLDEEKILFRLVVPANEVEPITDEFANSFAGDDQFRAVISSVEAMLPGAVNAVEIPDPEQPAPEPVTKSRVNRISREEMYTDVASGTELSGIYLLTTLLSALVAAVGLIRSDVAVVIGAMVIAPLLKPNMALALATTLGDTTLARGALKSNVGGASLAFVTSYLLGLVIQVNPYSDQILSRTAIDFGDVVLALCSGTAGALAFTSGVPATLIGVMVAVALLPPLVCVGLLLAAGEPTLAYGAFCLLLLNMTCVNLSAVTTFLIQGIRPMAWWEADQAKKSTRIAVLCWGLILAVLIMVIILESRI